MNPELTVVIPTYNNPEGAIDLVSDFYRLHNPDSFRIISIDQTEEGIKFNDKEPVHLHIRTHRNLGFSKAMNTGWKLVTTPYTLLANDDIRLLNPKWYDEAKADLDHEDVLATNPYSPLRTWDGQGNVVWLWDLEREIDGVLQGHNDDRFDFIKDKALRGAFDEVTDEDYQKLHDIMGLGVGGGTAMFFTLLKTNARHWVGLLDEAYWNNGEDYDWNRRCYLTCAKCKKRKGDHQIGGCEFQESKILTSKNSLVHHHCGVSKQKVEVKGGDSTYSTVVMGKNIFNEKWNITKEGNRDIYGDNGTSEPSMPWWSEVPL